MTRAYTRDDREQWRTAGFLRAVAMRYTIPFI